MDLIIKIIVIIFAISLILWALKFLTKLIFKILVPIAIIIAAYFAYQFLFTNNIIDDVTSLYCEKGNIDEIKCDCFVKPILADIEGRLTSEQLNGIKADPLKAVGEFRKSYINKKEEINACFEKNGKTSGIIDEIFEDIKKMSTDLYKRLSEE